MKDYIFTELGYFTKTEIEGIKEAMQGKTFMKFDIHSGSFAGNHTLIIRTDYEATEEEIKGMFISAALSALARAYRK